MSTTLEEISAKLDRLQLIAEQITDRIQVTGQQVVVVEGLSDIDSNLGLIKAGEFRSGTGDPGKGTGFTGVRIGSPGWTYSGTRYSIVGLNADALQFGLSNDDGSIYAGGGDITINANGINIQSSSADSIRFIHSTGYALFGHKPGSGLVLSTYTIHNYDAEDDLTVATRYGTLALYYGKVAYFLAYAAKDVANDNASISFRVGSQTSNVTTGSYNDLRHALISAPAYTASSASTVIRSATVCIENKPTLTNITATRHYALEVKAGGMWVEAGGLDLHNGTGAGDGSMSYSGDLMAYRNSTNYTGYIFVPLITPLTSTSWDGDTYSTVGTSTQLDLSSVFSAPAGIKAVLLQIIVSDSGGAGDYYFSCGGSSTYWYAATSRSVSASYNNEELCVVPCDSNGDIWYRIGASGSGTLSIWLRIFGYWI